MEKTQIWIFNCLLAATGTFLTVLGFAFHFWILFLLGIFLLVLSNIIQCINGSSEHVKFLKENEKDLGNILLKPVGLLFCGLLIAGSSIFFNYLSWTGFIAGDIMQTSLIVTVVVLAFLYYRSVAKKDRKETKE